MLFEKITFEEGERLILTVRRHWFVFFIRIAGVFTTAIAPFVVIAAALLIDATAPAVSSFMSSYGNVVLFASSLWLLMNWIALAFLWTDQYLDLWAITDRRVITIDQKSLFVRSIGSFRLEKLQDINVEIPGLFATLLNYGTVEAETASGGFDSFTAHGFPAPRELKALIMQASDARMKLQVSSSHDGVS